jgi:peptidoglycan hydrolase CwlO-like protein
MQVNILEAGWEILKSVVGLLAAVGLFVLKSYHEDSKILKEKAEKNDLLMQKMVLSQEEMTREISRMNRHVEQLMEKQNSMDREISRLSTELALIKSLRQ